MFKNTHQSTSGGVSSDAAYLPVLDGLRAIAILMVMVAHFNVEAAFKAALPVLGPVITKVALCGLRGVDLFFVLSGFLITRILLNARNNPAPAYYGTFYARRFIRIFPLYYACLAAVFLVLPRIVALDAPGLEIASHQWRLWAYLANWPHGLPVWDSSSQFALEIGRAHV
jgi:peptidoglycan/LPS O-acetylase OafA/YrhL